MVEKIKFLVEGNNDVQFLKAFVKINFGKTLVEANFHKISGWSGLTKQTERIAQFLEDNWQIILLIDTDSLEKQGGFAARSTFVHDFQTQNQFDFPYYLLPNHQNDGALENLIYDCIPNDASFKNCWTEYIHCLSANKNYHTPANKSMIMSYNELLTGDTSFSADFENTDYFDLKNNTNAAKLAAFLRDFIL
jgi:hypothetical protein